MLEFLDKMDRLERRLDRALGTAEAPKAPNRSRLTELSLGDFIPALTPRWERPDHLKPLLDVFERIRRGESVRVLLSVPPQHGKTETELHGLAWLLADDPSKTHAFVSYAADYAWSKSRLGRDYAKTAGVTLRGDSKAVHEWRTASGGGLLATGVGGPLTGHGISGVLLVDDPFKNRQEAESQLIRDHVHEWFTSTAMTRAHPSTSVVVVHTRWHPDDLIGRLQGERNADGSPKWECINLPAVSEDGAPLWPKHRPIEFLTEARERSEYDWWSMYMGTPRSRGGSVFQDARLYTTPSQPYRVAIGIDFAYTSKTHADWSVAVVLAQAGRTYYVLDVKRQQVAATQFASTLRMLQAHHNGARMFSFIGGTEKGVVDFLVSQGVRVHGEPAKADKFVRAQGVAAAWNDGRVLVPERAAWVTPLLAELSAFTGVNDKHDDQVDALAGAFACLNAPRVRYELGGLPEY